MLLSDLQRVEEVEIFVTLTDPSSHQTSASDG